jgi:hypothetical protein
MPIGKSNVTFSCNSQLRNLKAIYNFLHLPPVVEIELS